MELSIGLRITILICISSVLAASASDVNELNDASEYLGSIARSSRSIQKQLASFPIKGSLPATNEAKSALMSIKQTLQAVITLNLDALSLESLQGLDKSNRSQHQVLDWISSEIRAQELQDGFGGEVGTILEETVTLSERKSQSAKTMADSLGTTIDSAFMITLMVASSICVIILVVIFVILVKIGAVPSGKEKKEKVRTEPKATPKKKEATLPKPTSVKTKASKSSSKPKPLLNKTAHSKSNKSFSGSIESLSLASEGGGRLQSDLETRNFPLGRIGLSMASEDHDHNTNTPTFFY